MGTGNQTRKLMKKLARLNSTLLYMGLVILNSNCSSPKSDISNNNPVNYCRASQPEEKVGIVGGKQVHPSSWIGKRTIAILDKKKGSICTSTLISRSVLLTAAHCINSDLNAESVIAMFSSEPKCDLINRERHKNDLYNFIRLGKKVRIHPGYTSSNHQNDDLALIQLNADAPYEYDLMPQAYEDLVTSPFQDIMLVGYGKKVDYNTEDAQDPSDLKYTFVRPYSGTVTQKTNYRMSTTSKLYFSQANGTGACAGDSGGPALVRGRDGYLKQIGVASKVDGLESDFKKQEDVTCGKGVVYTSILYYQDWINKTLNELRSY